MNYMPQNANSITPHEMGRISIIVYTYRSNVTSHLGERLGTCRPRLLWGLGCHWVWQCHTQWRAANMLNLSVIYRRVWTCFPRTCIDG